MGRTSRDRGGTDGTPPFVTLLLPEPSCANRPRHLRAQPGVGINKQDGFGGVADVVVQVIPPLLSALSVATFCIGACATITVHCKVGALT